ILTREESPAKPDLVDTWKPLGATVECVRVADYPAMIQPPLTAKIPEQSITAIADWLTRMSDTDAPRVAHDSPGRSNAVCIEEGVSEEAVWFDERCFGILTQPASGPATRAMIFLNNAAGNRVGPHGMVPAIARAVARHGVAIFRIDLAGVGDSD